MQKRFRSSQMERYSIGLISSASSSPSFAFPYYQSFGHQSSWFAEDLVLQKGAGGVAPRCCLVFVWQRKALCPAKAKPAEEMQFLGHAVLER